ncbi:unnamed protein product [Symbiodinium natans]|uniref:Uncharacterized protein n=1 Tax=Symbiodinium natans TaxID=878477 RepID=A0A812KE95_9DINO|nr:unnamed protein product [Symbiodinium natans]
MLRRQRRTQRNITMMISPWAREREEITLEQGTEREKLRITPKEQEPEKPDEEMTGGGDPGKGSGGDAGSGGQGSGGDKGGGSDDKDQQNDDEEMDNKDDQPEENEESDDDILVRAEAGDAPRSLLFGGNPGGIADDDEAKYDTGEIDEKRKSVIEDVYQSRDSFPLGWMKKNYSEWEADEDKTVYKVTEKLISPEIIAQGLGLDNFSAPVEWMKNLRWGFHCGTCFAWWMGYAVATNTGEEFPREGARCPRCRKLQEVNLQGILQKGPPPAMMRAVVTLCSPLHPMDPRLILARLTDRLAAEGVPWDEIDMFEPHQILVAAGMIVANSSEAKLDVMDIIMKMAKELVNGGMMKTVDGEPYPLIPV